MAAPAFRASNNAFADATSITVTKPAGTAADDILVVGLFVEQTSVITPASGFAEISDATGTQGGSSPPYKAHMFWKRAGGSEPADYTFTKAGPAREMSIWMAAYSGAITSGDPVDVASFFASLTSTVSMKANSITTTVDDTMVIFFGTNFEFQRATPPGGMTEREDVDAVYLADVAQASAGATGDKTATLASAQWNTGSLIALKPPAAGGPDLPPLLSRHLNPVLPHEPHDLARMLPGKEIIPYVDPLVAAAFLKREAPYGIRPHLHA